MNFVKRFIITSGLLFGLAGCAAAFPGSSASAQFFNEVCSGGAANSAVCEEQKKKATNPLYGPDSVIIKAVNIVSLIVGIAAVIFIIVGGISYMLSTGDSSKVNEAKNTILYAIIGLAVLLLSRSIIIFVVNSL